MMQLHCVPSADGYGAVAAAHMLAAHSRSYSLSAMHFLTAGTAAASRPLQVRAAEERAEGVALELQYAQGEAVRAAQELALLRDQAERRARWAGSAGGWVDCGAQEALEPSCLLLLSACRMRPVCSTDPPCPYPCPCPTRTPPLLQRAPARAWRGHQPGRGAAGAAGRGAGTGKRGHGSICRLCCGAGCMLRAARLSFHPLCPPHGVTPASPRCTP